MYGPDWGDGDDESDLDMPEEMGEKSETETSRVVETPIP
jgi:hypothetical protein